MSENLPYDLDPSTFQSNPLITQFCRVQQCCFIGENNVCTVLQPWLQLEVVNSGNCIMAAQKQKRLFLSDITIRGTMFRDTENIVRFIPS